MGISNIYIEWLTSVNLRDGHIYQQIYTQDCGDVSYLGFRAHQLNKAIWSRLESCICSKKT